MSLPPLKPRPAFLPALLTAFLSLAPGSGTCILAAADTTALAPVDLVDPFIGTAGGGHVYPGVTVPFGFIQVSPDTLPFTGAGGYNFNKPINGFSQQHISGMGGPLFGQFSLMPITGAFENPSHVVAATKSAEQATLGYYSVTLAPWNVKVELTATKHVALHRHTYPAAADSRLLVDVGHCLFGTAANWASAKPFKGEVHVNAAAREISGTMTYHGGRRWEGAYWKVHFVARPDIPFESFGTWADSTSLADGVAHQTGAEIGAYLTFPTTAGQVVNTRVAVSFRSVEQARAYLDSESNAGDFDTVRARTRALWADTLDAIRVDGASHDQLRQFYTALYRMHLTPNDWTGEAPARYGDGVYYENLLCMWDTFRNVHPLLSLIQPKVNADIINTLIAYHEHDGWTGDAHSAWTYEHVQVGSHADSIIADAYAKKLPGVDWKRAYAAIRKNAFVDPNPAINQRGDRGRFRLNDYRRHHYLPTDVSAYKGATAVSRTLEFVHNDFSVLSLARDFGTPEDIADLEGRMLWYNNVWDDSTGFMRGRLKDGSWIEPFDPLKHETGKQYYEGHAWTWSWYVPHDSQGLITLHGGVDPFVKKLTIACALHYEPFNEPGMLQTYLFIHAGRPDLTQKFVRSAFRHYSSAPDGLPGNDDSGTTSGWLVWSMLGLYPHAGEDYYYIGSPSFKNATLALGNGKRLVLRAPAASEQNIYVKSVTLNGRPWNQAWVRHADLIDGAELVFEMVSEPTTWGASGPVPPSWSSPAAAR